jgi:hypothetical protein
VRLLALRPIVDGPGVFRLDDGGAPATLPGGSTWWFRDAATLARAGDASDLPDLPIEGDTEGVVDLSHDRLVAMKERTLQIGLRTGAGRPDWFRLTIFTAMGYLCCVFPDHGDPASPHGTIDLLQFFGGDLSVGVPPERSRIAPARYGLVGDAYAMLGLRAPTIHDLAPRFPVLLESGRIEGERFVATHRARRLLTFGFDRRYPAWVSWALNTRG